MSAPTIAVLATLDSKDDAARYTCDVLREAGAVPWLMDLSLRPHDKAGADVGGAELAEASGVPWEDLAKACTEPFPCPPIGPNNKCLF